jgi:predicted DCC family thiol-disulfide oxidoreductase YuxK
VGIFVEFPIPWFALGVTALYFLMVPIHWWPKLRCQYKVPQIRFLYDGECPLCLRTRLTLSHFDCFKGVQFQSVQSQQDSEPLLKEYSETELLNDVFSINKNGQVNRGIDTYIQAFWAMGYLIPLSLFLRLPGVYHAMSKVYSVVAQNRTTERCTDEVCGVPTLLEPHQSPQLFKNITARDIQVQLVAIGLVAAVVMQLAVSYQSPLPQKWIRQSGLRQTSVGKVLHTKTQQLKRYSREMFGITNHGVFMDSHFRGYRHVIAVTYKDKSGKETFLPIIDENGMPGPYIYGFNWVKWTFRVNGPRVKPHLLEAGVRDFTAFWARKKGVSLKNAVFNIKVKKIDLPKTWRKDYLRDQLQKPWQDGGYIRWKNKKFYSAIKNIEKI